jgi:hypothetical protein
MFVNSPQDLLSVEQTPEVQAALTAMYNDFVKFDDAVYPPDYDWNLQPGDPGYIAPVIRVGPWNATAAASWGFDSREAVGAAIGIVEGAVKD